MRWTVPNILTVLRLFAAPMVALIFVAMPRGPADWIAFALFVGAAITDWFDGYLARKWNQQSLFGAMLDPIADKAMVVIALSIVVILAGLTPLVVIPVVVILFREVFVSGLREFLGDTAGTLKVTRLAKWKTTAQMIAIAVLLARGGFENMLFQRGAGMDAQIAEQILAGELPDEVNLRFADMAWTLTGQVGIVMLWVAAALTFITGVDYFRKSLPHLKEG